MKRIACPHCGTPFQTRKDTGVVECPDCGSALRLGKGRQSSSSQNSSDNKVALQLMGAVIVGIIVVGTVVMMSSNDVEPRERKSGSSNDADFMGSGTQKPSPSRDSLMPQEITRRLLIAVAKEDEEKVSEFFWWQRVFSRLARSNNWSEERRWENLDEAGRDKAKQKYLFEVMDPDYARLISDRLKDDLEANVASPTTNVVGDDYGTISFTVMDIADRPLLQIQVKVNLLESGDPIADLDNIDAWRVVDVQFVELRTIKVDGKTKKKRSVGADIGKPAKKKRVRRGPVGPAETEPRDVAWLSGTSDAGRTEMGGLIDLIISDDRGAIRARRQLVRRGKEAIPPLLTRLSKVDYKDADVGVAFQLILALREITGQTFGYQPGRATGAGGPGMTTATPEERVRGVRRWFGWWDKYGAGFTVKKEEAVDFGLDGDN